MAMCNVSYHLQFRYQFEGQRHEVESGLTKPTLCKRKPWINCPVAEAQDTCSVSRPSGSTVLASTKPT